MSFQNCVLFFFLKINLHADLADRTTKQVKILYDQINILEITKERVAGIINSKLQKADTELLALLELVLRYLSLLYKLFRKENPENVVLLYTLLYKLFFGWVNIPTPFGTLKCRAFLIFRLIEKRADSAFLKEGLRRPNLI